MTNLVERLRREVMLIGMQNSMIETGPCAICQEAADEIERLRHQLKIANEKLYEGRP